MGACLSENSSSSTAATPTNQQNGQRNASVQHEKISVVAPMPLSMVFRHTCAPLKTRATCGGAGSAGNDRKRGARWTRVSCDQTASCLPWHRQVLQDLVEQIGISVVNHPLHGAKTLVPDCRGARGRSVHLQDGKSNKFNNERQNASLDTAGKRLMKVWQNKRQH